MGWAQRVKVRAGNPTPAALPVTFIRHDKFNAGNRRAKFSDRE